MEERRLRVFETRVLRGVFGTKRNALTGEWRKELHDLYSSLTIVPVIKSRSMGWAGNVARLGEGEACTWFWWGNLRERDHWGDPGVDWSIILRWIFREWDVLVWAGLRWLRIETGGWHL
jgi:hypothetical protein